jgi:hypothetical protein
VEITEANHAPLQKGAVSGHQRKSNRNTETTVKLPCSMDTIDAPIAMVMDFSRTSGWECQQLLLIRAAPHLSISVPQRHPLLGIASNVMAYRTRNACDGT